MQEKYEKNKKEVEKHAVVKDATGIEKPLDQVVNDGIKNSNLGYNKGVGEVLNDNLNPEEKITMAEVEQGKKEFADTKNEINKEKANTPKSTVYRAGKSAFENTTETVEKVGNTSTAIINDANKLITKKLNKGKND